MFGHWRRLWRLSGIQCTQKVHCHQFAQSISGLLLGSFLYPGGIAIPYDCYVRVLGMHGRYLIHVWFKGDPQGSPWETFGSVLGAHGNVKMVLVPAWEHDCRGLAACAADPVPTCNHLFRSVCMKLQPDILTLTCMNLLPLPLLVIEFDGFVYNQVLCHPAA